MVSCKALVSPILNTSQTDNNITIQHPPHPVLGALCSEEQWKPCSYNLSQSYSIYYSVASQPFVLLSYLYLKVLRISTIFIVTYVIGMVPITYNIAFP